MWPDLDRTIIVGLGHKARHGKDTVAGLLQPALEAVGLTVGRYSYARALYDHCRSQHGMTTKDAPLLQRVGVEARQVDPNTWTRTVAWRIADEAPRVALVTDVRFTNEADLIRDRYHGLVVRVRRTVDGAPFVDPSRPADHSSETQLDGYDFDLTIENAGSIEALKVDALQLAALVVDMSIARGLARLSA